MLLYICIKFHENISKDFRAIEGLLFSILRIFKGHNSVKTVGRVMVLVLCILSDVQSFMKTSKRISEVLSGNDFQ